MVRTRSDPFASPLCVHSRASSASSVLWSLLLLILMMKKTSAGRDLKWGVMGISRK